MNASRRGWLWAGLWAGLVLGGVSWGAPVELCLRGERLDLRARQAPLVDVLAAFSRLGVDVYLDPEIQATVNVVYRDADLESALAEMLAGYGYTFTWRALPTPMGEFVTLRAMRVFQPGRVEAAQPLRVDPAAQVSRGSSGTLPPHRAQELLLTLRPGVSVAQFRNWLVGAQGQLVDSIPGLGIYLLRFPPHVNLEDIQRQWSANPQVHSAELNWLIPMPAPRPAAAGPAATIDFSAVPLPSSDRPAVAILDSGLAAHPALEGSVFAAYNALDPAGEMDDPAGHGTQMALISAGRVTPAGGVAGAGAPVLAIRAFDADGQATSFGLLRGLHFAAESGARVVNLSWGTATDSELLRTAVAYAQAQGMVVVAAAGNEPSGQPVYPAAYPGVIAVAAGGADGQPAAYSNYGDFVFLAAPGAANLPVGYGGPPGAYAGTSIASAYTAAVIAAYLEQHPGADSVQVRAALRAALEQPQPGYGHGALDAAAVNRLLEQAAP